MLLKLAIFNAVAFLLIFASLSSELKSNRKLSVLSRAFENLTQTLYDGVRKPMIRSFGVDMNTVNEIVVKKVAEKSAPVIIEFILESKSLNLSVYESAVLIFDSFKTFA